MEKQYIGKGKSKTFDKGGTVINCWVKKSDMLPEDSDFIHFTVTLMKKPDEKGNDYTIYQQMK